MSVKRNMRKRCIMRRNTLIEKVIHHFDSSVKEYSQKSRLFRYSKIDDYLTSLNLKSDVYILEVGAGGGQYLSLLSKRGYQNIIALDISKKLLKTIKSEKINKIVADAENLPFKDNSIDVIISVSLLHHLVSSSPRSSKRKAESAVKEMSRVARNLILVDESPTVRHKIFTYLCYYITYLVSIFNIFNIVIVNFMTPEDLREIFQHTSARYSKIKIIKRDISKLPLIMKIGWKIIGWFDVFIVQSKFPIPR